MGKGKSKKKEPTPEPDTVILYIENPIGIYGAKDWYKNQQALSVVSAWLYLLADAGGLERPSSLWYRGAIGSSFLRDIAVDLYVPGSDASRVQYALGYHDWKDFARLPPRLERDLMLPQVEEDRVTAVYLSPCRSTIKLDSDQFLKIPLVPSSHVNIRDFNPGPYPPPALPPVPTLKTTYKEPLPTRPLPPPSPTPAPQPPEVAQPPEAEDEEKKEKKAVLASTALTAGRSSPATKQEGETAFRTKEEQLEHELLRLAESRHLTSPPPQETKPVIASALARTSSPPQETKPNVTSATATKEEQLEHEMLRLAENRHLTSPPPQETKPDITRALATKQEQLEHELSRLAENNHLATPEPPQETKPNVKEEQLSRELEVLAASGGMVPPERRSSSTVKPDPDAQTQVKREPIAANGGDGGWSRTAKEEQLELEMARLTRSPSSTAALSSSVKQEPGSYRSMPPSRGTTESSVGPLERNTPGVVKSEEGSSTPNPLKRVREGQNGQGHSAEKRLKREWEY